MIRTTLAVLVLCLPALAGNSIYVDVNATPPGNGTQASPYTSISYALAQPSTADSSQIYVAPGTYYDNIDTGPRTMGFFATGGPDVTILRPVTSAPILSSDMPWLAGFNVHGFTFACDGGPQPSVAVVMMRGFISNCVIRDNSGIGFMSTFDVVMQHCTVTGNGVGVSDYYNSCMYLRDSIVWGNAVDFVSTDGCTSTDHAHVGGADPLFWDLAHHDVRLRPGSPCIGAAIGGLDQGAFAFAAGYAPAPAAYCAGKVSSQGCVPAIGSQGEASATNASPFMIQSTLTVDHKLGLLVYGYAEQSLPFQGGTLCVGQFQRTPAQDSGGSGACTGHWRLDMNVRIQSGIDPNLVPGRMVYAQWWGRDPQDPAGFGSQLSDALRFGIAP